MDNNKMELSSNVTEFEVQGIKILGNFENSQVIGLDKKGEKLIQYIREKGSKPIELSSDDIILLKELKERQFLKNEQEKNQETLLDSAYLHVTDHCNLHCIGCYSYITGRNAGEDLSLKQIKSILKQLTQVGVTTLIISGGEPLFRNDLEEICKYAKIVGV